MKLQNIAAALVAALAVASVPAQDDTFVRVAARVSSSRAGAAVIDRGSRDRVEEGDRVFLFPRSGGTYRGTVAQLDERSAVVELDERDFVADAGTRGEVLVPRARVGQRVPVDPPPDVVEPAPDATEHPPWKPRDDGWQRDMPLLAKVRTVRPEERPSRLTGRVWGLGDYVETPDDGRGSRTANSAARLGTRVRVDNPFGQGGAFRFDGELAYRTRLDALDPATVGVVRALSYEIGGTRFAPNRFEFGRFLQRGMPEFGIVDGVEWNRRFDGGDRVGVSLGFMPNPYDELRSDDDFQFAVSYHLAADDLERLTLDVGYQKSYHHSDADRDLFLIKTRYLPGDGWDVSGTAWVDYYTGGENLKGRTIDVTQAWASVRRLFEDGAGWDLTYRHYSFPLFQRDVFQPLTPSELADNVSDRLALEGFTGAPGAGRLRGEIGGWADEDENGGFAEIGLGFHDAIVDGGELELTGFGTIGKFTSILGARVALGRNTQSGRWDLLYEAANNHLDGRDSGGDDLLQHRLRASHSFFAGGGWNWSLHGEALLWDTELAWSAGFHVEKSF